MQTAPKLIDQFVPNNYNLSLSLNRLKRTFGGIVIIKGATPPDVDSIILHSKDLTIESITFDGKEASYSYAENDSLVITHPDINDGNHILVIAYNGKINDSMHGLYPCYYNHNGIRKELLATQFESHHAREVFPCIDEPAAKATFDVTLTTEPNITVLGNMPIKTQKNENNELVTTFETTPIMSSYLLAWVVGELHKKTATTKGGVEVNVWATLAQTSESLDLALDIATRSIDFFDEYFETPYPLPKSDHVALPDFSSGAMENWGLITYREVALLADPETTSISSKHYIATVIAHELSHQWFGNLVTMKWWNDLWLNESFASLIEYIAVDALEPSWNIWLDFASLESVVALRRDSLAGVQSVQTDVNHPDEIDTLFDGAIVYAKGARLLQMLRCYIGEESFRAGLKQYFITNAYKNTSAHDLWSAFKDVSNKDVESFMNKWISQPGFPVLHVSQTNNQLLLTQERLVDKSAEPSDTLWPILLNSTDPQMPEIFETRSLSIIRKNTDTLRFNVNNNAHFITHYNHSLLKSIIEQLDNHKLSSIDRLQLLNEQNILANVGIISSSELISLLNSYRNETVESVLDIISLTIGGLKKFVENDKLAESKLHTLTQKLVIDQYKRLGWYPKPNEVETDTKLRGIVLGLMLFSENPDTIASAIELFHSATLEKLDPELREVAISATVSHEGKDADIELLLKTYSETGSAELRQDICSGLTSTRSIKVIDKLLNLVKDTSIIRTQDTSRWLIYLIRNKYSRLLTWQWIRDNWDWINQTFSGDKSYDEYPRYAATALITEEQLDEYRDFFTPMQSDPALSRVIEMGINEIKNRIDTIARDGKSVRNALLEIK